MARTIDNPTEQSGKGFILAVAAVVVLGLGAVAFFVSSRGEGAATREAGEQTGAVDIGGEDTLPAMPPQIQLTNPDNEPSFGQVAPTLTGTDFDGNEVVIEPDGRAKAIYFLAHWCSHCQVEAPLVQGLIDAGRVPEGLDIYAVSTAVDRGKGNFPVSTWLEDEVGFTPPVIRDSEESDALAAFGSGGFPYVVYLDSDHKVMARSSGELGSEAIAQMWQVAAGS